MADKHDVNRTIRRLVGVYNANGSVGGELAYFIGARLGRAHCALCDITHGLVREAAAWKTFRVGLPVHFDLYHRDDQPADTRLATGGNVPAVLAETDDEYVAVLGPAELGSCGGSIEHFAHAIETAVTRVGLSWPSRSGRSGAAETTRRVPITGRYGTPPIVPVSVRSWFHG